MVSVQAYDVPFSIHLESALKELPSDTLCEAVQALPRPNGRLDAVPSALVPVHT